MLEEEPSSTEGNWCHMSRTLRALHDRMHMLEVTWLDTKDVETRRVQCTHKHMLSKSSAEMQLQLMSTESNMAEINGSGTKAAHPTRHISQLLEQVHVG